MYPVAPVLLKTDRPHPGYVSPFPTVEEGTRTPSQVSVGPAAIALRGTCPRRDRRITRARFDNPSIPGHIA